MNDDAEAMAGRPSAKGTAADVVAAARVLFAQRGYDGASVRAITRAAGANLGAITYHFGSKRALYEAVLDSVLTPLAEDAEGSAERAASPLGRIEAVVGAFFRFLRRHPEAPQLLLQETATGRAPPEAVRRNLGRILRVLSGAVEAGQRDGTIRSGDPLLLSIAAISQPIHLSLVRRIAAAAFDLDQEDPGTRRRVREHALTFVRAALTRRPEEEARSDENDGAGQEEVG